MSDKTIMQTLKNMLEPRMEDIVIKFVKKNKTILNRVSPTQMNGLWNVCSRSRDYNSVIEWLKNKIGIKKNKNSQQKNDAEKIENRKMNDFRRRRCYFLYPGFKDQKMNLSECMQKFILAIREDVAKLLDGKVSDNEWNRIMAGLTDLKSVKSFTQSEINEMQEYAVITFFRLLLKYYRIDKEVSV